MFAALDAGRGEIYAAEYEMGKLVSPPGERLLTREEFVQAANQHTVVTPDDVVAEVASSAGLRLQKIEHPRSDAIARLGWQKITSGQTVSVEDLEANYIRRSDAEIFSTRISS